MPLLDLFLPHAKIEHVLVVEDSYEELLASVDADSWRDPELDEDEAAAMCYTSGTTGMPKGVLYSHRSTMLHTLGVAAGNPMGLGDQRSRHDPAGRADVPRERLGLPVPRDHARLEARLPGAVPRPGEPARGLRAGTGDVDGRRADDLDGDPRDARCGARPLGPLAHEGDARRRVGGAARDDRRLQAARPQRRPRLGDDRDLAGRVDGAAARATSRRPTRRRSSTTSRCRAFRCRSSSCATATPKATCCPGTASRWASSRYAARGSRRATTTTPEQSDRWTDDGWFKTGDVVSLHPRGFIQIKDRSKDVIKSGGEWISSVELENALMAHPAVAEAAVIAIPDAKWDERPLAAVVLREGATATGDELRDFLAPNFAKWWLPDRYEFIDRDPEDECRQVPEDGAARDVRERAGAVLIKTVWLDNPPVNAVNAGSSRRSGRSSRRSTTMCASSSCAARASGLSPPAPTSPASSAARPTTSGRAGSSRQPI